MVDPGILRRASSRGKLGMIQRCGTWESGKILSGNLESCEKSFPQLSFFFLSSVGPSG